MTVLTKEQIENQSDWQSNVESEWLRFHEWMQQSAEYKAAA
jgi:hypothetical protein